MLDQIALGEARVLRDHVEGDYLAGVLVGLRDSGAFEDSGVCGRDCLDFVGVDVEA